MVFINKYLSFIDSDCVNLKLLMNMNYNSSSGRMKIQTTTAIIQTIDILNIDVYVKRNIQTAVYQRWCFPVI